MKYKLKDGINFNMVNKKSKIRYDFDLSNYYDKETRIFTFPQDYIAWHLMAEVFRDFLEPLNLIEKVGESDER